MEWECLDGEEKALRQALDAGESIEPPIKRKDAFDLVLLHDGKVDCVTRRDARMAHHNILRAECGQVPDREHLIDNSEQSIKCRLDSIAAADGYVAMQDFLEHFGIGNKAIAFTDELFDQALGVRFVRVRRADQIHGYVRVD